MFRFIDALIEPGTRARASTEELTQLRVLAAFTAGMFVLTTMIGLAIVVPGYGTPSAIGILSFYLTLLGIVAARLRIWGRTRGAALLVCTGLIVAASFAGAHANGLHLIVSPTAALIIVLAVYLSDGRGALWVTLLTVAAIAIIAAVHLAGLEPPPFVATDDRRVFDAVVGVLVLFALLGLLSLMNAARQRAYASLQEALATLEASEAARARAETELRLAQKLEAVGRLAAGVAHEINTPVQYVTDSVSFLRQAAADATVAVSELRALRAAVTSGEPAEALAQAAHDAAVAEEEADLEYLAENVPRAFDRALDGLSRVAEIVRSMKELAHPDAKEMTWFDLNHAVSNTLSLVGNEYKYVAELDLDLGDVPRVLGHPGELNQVLINLVVNAAQAIEERVPQKGRGRITVRTHTGGGSVELSVTDTGGGIPAEVREQIFTPFFTTKQVGRGTGQGLAISRTVVERHGGSITFESTPGEGTTFRIRLPLEPAKKEAA